MMTDEKAVRLGLEHWPTKCHRIWDPVEARFEKCFLPIIPTIPTGVAVFILLSTTIAPLFKYQPTWTKPFVEELMDRPHELLPDAKKYWPGSTIALLVISILGLFAQCIAMFYTSSRIIIVLTSTSWVVASALVVINRPKTTPFSLLALYSSLLVSHSIIFIDNHPALRHDSIATILGALTALLAIAIILHMPMRDSDLPDDQISQVFEAPDPRLRSPEDNLTLWQFMTISWMEPLISLGAKRQLNDQDVWQLGYEFQHKRLHDKFRELRGTVLRRVLEANKIDLVLVSFLGLVELLADYSTPVLLQQLLRSMEDVHAPRRAAVIYAVLSLIARLIADQTAVFSLWYSRRCFERSRGEMIMMLYEKMLMRKVVGLEEDRPETDSELATGRPPDHPGGTNEEGGQAKQSASMGMVLNLMRGDVYEVAQR
ncbi:hypothetical protein GJ744_004723 [Endocarpon pusillum]|uniref:Uncharacterized protein n=1 Tax=Endocarpon pusillum TaxID=364733 RepID=A0A8H7A9E4_9EURO|nr:hypothetical protein GJ744_004723 [Endocarpon pusillum]